ncbi:response regulator [Rhizobium sp. L1K21]|uniref:response regulator n=1 Tax=Rhizobium sp. L1K21 TaxID=2954933 RepID=UPI002093E36A|nr:response regulator [Rhizobium sp. L1K21]MCO6186954.1 response regulator [Rhizobium sp. L1K21]
MENVASLDVDILKAVINTSCDAFDQAVLVYDRNDAIIFASKQILRFFPVDPDDLMPGTAMRHLLGAIFDSTERYHDKTVHVSREDWIAHRLATQWNEKFDSVSRYGADRWLLSKGGRAANGIGITVLQDISDAKRRERKWQADMDRMASVEALLDDMPFPLFIKDQDLAFIGVNKAFCNLYGIRAEDVLGRTVWDLTDGALAACLEASNRKVMETGEPSHIFEEKKMPNGGHCKFIRHEFRVGKPENYLLITILDDVTMVLENAMEMQSFEPKADDAERPSGDDFEAAGKEAGPAATENATRDAVRILLVCEDKDFTALCTETLQQYDFDACAVISLEEEKAFLAEAERFSLLPHIVLVDESFGEAPGEIAAEHGVIAMAFNTGRPVHFLVGDILANLPKSAGGQMEEPRPGDDEAIFAPAGLPLFDGPDDLPIYRYSDVEVLVVEDNPVNQQAFSSILDGLGIHYRIAASGEDAIAMFEELRPKLVFLDVTLPGISAYETAQHIALFDVDRPTRTPVVGVLTHEDAAEEAACVDAGMSSCIVKPISTEALELVYYRHVEGRPKGGAKTKARLP